MSKPSRKFLRILLILVVIWTLSDVAGVLKYEASASIRLIPDLPTDVVFFTSNCCCDGVAPPRKRSLLNTALYLPLPPTHCCICLQYPTLDLGSPFLLHPAPWRLPQAGYYCPGESTTLATPVACGSPTVFCPAGSTEPVPVNAGYYSVGGGSDGTMRSSQVSVA